MDIENRKPNCLSYRNLAWSYYCCAVAVLDKYGAANDSFGIGVELRLVSDLSKEDHFDKKVLITPTPFFYLLQHSLELYMKGYLIYKETTFTSQQLKETGHLLNKLVEKCSEIKHDFFTEQEVANIKRLNGLIKRNHITRYPLDGGGDMPFPNWRCICDVLDKFEAEFRAPMDVLLAT